MGIKYFLTSHETFSHDSIDSLGYDWERIANPNIQPRYPFKIYLPQSTEDIIKAVTECNALQQTLIARSKGHSSNDLVVSAEGNILLTEKLNRILEFNEDELWVEVQSGAVVIEVDNFLSTKGLGLPVVGDHNHITVGGFASVGGISPASHRFGMFLDNVISIEFVDWEGNLVNCSINDNVTLLRKVLGGTGQHGVIVTLKLRIIKIDKEKTILKNKRELFTKVEQFIQRSNALITNPGDAQMERGLWIDFPLGSTNLRLGQFSSYQLSKPSLMGSLTNSLQYGFFHVLGHWAGRLPDKIDRIIHYLGIAGVILAPSYASIRNIESFTDKIIDETVGDPTRMFIALAPIVQYKILFQKLLNLMMQFRFKYQCLTFIAVYVKAIRSSYLSGGREPAHFCELMFFVGIKPENMTSEVLDELISQMDDICIEHQAYRYMHSKTVKDTRRSKIDANYQYI